MYCIVGVSHHISCGSIWRQASVSPDNLAESFGLEPSPQTAAADVSTQPPSSTSSPSCSITNPDVEAQTPPTTLPSQPAPPPPAVSSSLLTSTFPCAPPTSSHSPEVPAPSAPSVTQHYVTLTSTAQLVPPPSTPGVSSTPAVTTEVTAAVTHTVPLAPPPPPPPPPTITIAPTLGLQPSIVMSDQNLQWILSSAASAQQNPEQQVQQSTVQLYLWSCFSVLLKLQLHVSILCFVLIY